MKKTINILLFLLVGLISSAQQVTAIASLDSFVILTGDQINYKLEVKIPSILKNEIKVSWPLFNDTIIDKIEIISKSKIDTLNTDEYFSLKQKIKITGFDSGYYILPQIPIVINYKGNIDTLKSNSKGLYIASIPTDTTNNNIYDIAPPHEAPFVITELLIYAKWIILSSLVISGILLFVLWYIKKYRKNPKPEKTINLPPDIIALNELNNLKNEELWQKGEVKEYYSKLTDIIRKYIEARFQIPAMEQVSSEIITDLLKVNIVKEAIPFLEEMFLLADLSKFAKHTPLEENNIKVFDVAYDFVLKTKNETDIEKNDLKPV